MENEADNALNRNAAIGGCGNTGKHVDVANVFEHSKLISTSVDACDAGRSAANLLEYPDNRVSTSPTDKARQLPRRIWMIVAAAFVAWAVVITMGYAILV